MQKMWILLVILLVLAAHFNLAALVPLQIGDDPPPWWVGGQLLWPFAEEADTLLLSRDGRNALAPILGITSGVCFLMAAAALLRWRVPRKWFAWLTVAGAVFSIALQLIWFTGWAVLPLLVDAVLLWLIFSKRVSVDSLRGPASRA
ncbi:MAG: hypothetical protein KJ047_02760 [Anaerolineae bacterium]|nr:hypothetical protein [Anaerolineae bacterium]